MSIISNAEVKRLLAKHLRPDGSLIPLSEIYPDLFPPKPIEPKPAEVVPAKEATASADTDASIVRQGVHLATLATLASWGITQTHPEFATSYEAARSLVMKSPYRTAEYFRWAQRH